jgi:hypothetical protein
MSRANIWNILSKLAFVFVLAALVTNIYYKSFYFGDASFRLFQGISIGQAITPFDSLFSSGTNRHFIDFLRAVPIITLTKIGFGFADIVLFNQIFQILFTVSVVTLCSLHLRKHLSHNQLTILATSFIVYGLAVTTYLDNYILIAGPILILISVLYASTNTSLIDKYLLYILLLISFSLHELSILVFPFLMIYRFFELKEKGSRDLDFKDLLLFSSFSVNLYLYLIHRSSLATGSQILQSEIFSVFSPEDSSGVYLLVIFILLVVVNFSYMTGWIRFTVESLLTLLLLLFSFIFFAAQVNGGYPNRWIGVIYRNDLAFSIVITLLVALSIHKLFNSKQIDVKKSFLKTNLVYVFPAFIIASSLVSMVFSSSWSTCWDKSLNQAKLNGGQIASGDVQRFGSCHWDWVDPMTSIIMSDSNYVQNLVLPDGQDIKDLSGEDSDSLMLPYGIRINTSKLQLQIGDGSDKVKNE